MLTLWRREVPDSGGPGRHRGGVAASVAITPHGTSVPMGLVLASAGKAVAQNAGLCGGPLTRDPDVVAHDVREQKVTASAARSVYGVVVADGVADLAATTAERDRHRARRRDRSQVLGETRGQASLAAARRLDDNLVEVPAPGGSGTVVACRHCAEILGGSGAGSGAGDTLALALYEGPSTEAGPQIIADPADYVDAPIVFRQYCCPSCWTALYSAVVPAGHTDTVASLGRLTAAPGR